MRKINSHGSNTVMAGVLLLALLTSANVLAEPRPSPADDAMGLNDPGRNSAQAANLGTTGSDEAYRRQPASKGASARSRSATTARVFLDDYQRIPQRVTKQYPTKPYWVGAKKDQGKSPE
jgi:hypothetical protein